MNDKFFDLKSEKQDRMINASLKIFAINGYKHASTDDIVKEAGISKGLLFHYFINKMGLYSFLIDYSVKYMSFEFSRTIGEETDYFSYLEKLETAKLNVLKNYPYMNEFIENAISENRSDMEDSAVAALKVYKDMFDKYRAKLSMPAMRNGVDIEQFENMINYTIKGLTVESMGLASFKPEQLNKKIIEYLQTFKKLTAN
ncbi:MAG: TetR/AcrR family transcriptional regulator [Lachnospiraceae bacterium]|nr:TetR/AcrR family transcriptional regulator [Lachnospiraceae bacterium]MBP5745588.1 TetR/AcrR family transcriptional regulator [Lachnospiraceae bacterium]